MQEKLQLLREKLSAYDELAVAFSGGVDSTFLLLQAAEVIGEGLLAVTLTGPMFPPDELADTKRLCEEHDIPQLIINMPDSLFAEIADNTPNRCYTCKKGVFSLILDAADGKPVADGTNADDMSDYRPGLKALKELKILSPLQETGFTKEEIRLALKAMNVEIWDKPSYACLASRIPYGEKLTPGKMQQLYEIEAFIHELGFPQVRVRHHGKIAIVEVPPEQRGAFGKPEVLDAVSARIKKEGFLYATMDMEGYKTGKLNAAITKD